MKTILCILMLATAAVAAVPGAVADPGNGNSWFGLCTAWKNNETGRENGNAENSTAFQALQQEAEDQGYDSVEAFCDTVPHPGGGNGGNRGGNGNGRPDDVPRGPPL